MGLLGRLRSVPVQQLQCRPSVDFLGAYAVRWCGAVRAGACHRMRPLFSDVAQSAYCGVPCVLLGVRFGCVPNNLPIRHPELERRHGNGYPIHRSGAGGALSVRKGAQGSLEAGSAGDNPGGGWHLPVGNAWQSCNDGAHPCGFVLGTYLGGNVCHVLPYSPQAHASLRECAYWLRAVCC